jgi:hypothetical protein
VLSKPWSFAMPGADVESMINAFTPAADSLDTSVRVSVLPPVEGVTSPDFLVSP